MRVRSKLSIGLLGVAAALAVTACTATLAGTDSAEPIASETAALATPRPGIATSRATITPTADPAYTAAVSAYPQALPDGYAFPPYLSGAESADKWWWCSQIDAAWEAYFRREDETEALGYLRAAADVDPGSYGRYDQADDALPLNEKVDRDVRFIGGGVDSQYVEYTAHGCWKWAKSVGAEFPPVS